MNAKYIDPEYHSAHPYRYVLGDEYDMNTSYNIVRSKGTKDCLMMLTLDGGGLANGELLGPKSVFLYKENEPHNYRTDPAHGRWRFLWLHFRAEPSWHILMDFRKLDLESVERTECRRIVALFTDAVRLSASKRPVDGAIAYNLVENILLRLYRARHSSEAMNFRDEEMLYIRTHLREKLTLTDLSARRSLSVSRYAHKFKDAFGVSPQQMIEMMRLDYAHGRLALGNTSVKTVAIEAGFQDPLYFSRRYKRRFGNPPSCNQNP